MPVVTFINTADQATMRVDYSNGEKIPGNGEYVESPFHAGKKARVTDVSGSEDHPRIYIRELT